MYTLQGSDTDDGVEVLPNHLNIADQCATMEGDCQFMPFIRTMQRIVLYMTKSRIYIVGSNNMPDDLVRYSAQYTLLNIRVACKKVNLPY